MLSLKLCEATILKQEELIGKSAIITFEVAPAINLTTCYIEMFVHFWQGVWTPTFGC